jgi:hypothetical protein
VANFVFVVEKYFYIKKIKILILEITQYIMKERERERRMLRIYTGLAAKTPYTFLKSNSYCSPGILCME